MYHMFSLYNSLPDESRGPVSASAARIQVSAATESSRWNAGRGRVAADGSRAQDLGARNHIESWHW